MREIDIREYWDVLERHDWFYEQSDDFRAWTAGRDERLFLLEHAKDSEQHLAAWEAWNKYIAAVIAEREAEQPTLDEVLDD